MRAATVVLLWAAGGLWLVAAATGFLAGRTRAGLWAASLTSSLGGAAALVGGIELALGRVVATFHFSAAEVGTASVRLDPLAAAFILLLGLVALSIGLFAPRYHVAGHGTAIYLAVYNAALIASLAVLVAGSVTAFLVAWESMTLTSGLLILRRQGERGVTRGALLFLALGEVGFALILGAFVILWVKTGSPDFAVIAARSSHVSYGWRATAYLLALVGFGFKAGIVPLHIWLPVAHPVAPADGSGFLSGLVIKLGVYGIVLFAFELLGRGPSWWGVITMALGAVTAVVGVLYAVIERDFKRLLAFHSIENIGIIITAVGAAMTFVSFGRVALGGFLLLCGLYHVMNHGTYKTLLFLEAGAIEHATKTRDLDAMGGLVHRMKATAVITLIGTLGIAGLPPLNGFVSEWLVFQGLFQAFRIPPLPGALVVVAAAALALSGGLAVLAFAHAYGIAFLGMPRSAEVARANERHAPILGPAVLAAACVGLALGAPAVLIGLDDVVWSVTGVQLRSRLLLGNLTIIPAHTDFSAFSPTYLACFLIGVMVVPIAIYLARRTRGTKQTVPVWDGGIISFKARMQYTGTTFSNPTRITFERFYQPELKVERASEDPAGTSGPVHYQFKVRALFEDFIYDPVVRIVWRISNKVAWIQEGDVNVYLLYILVALIVVYLVELITTYK